MPPQLSHIRLKSNSSSFDTTPTGTTVRNSINLDNFDNATNDDGYCEIDEIRFVSRMASSSNADNIIIEADTNFINNSRASADTISEANLESNSTAIDLSNNNDTDNLQSDNVIIDEQNIANLPAENVIELNESTTTTIATETIDQHVCIKESQSIQLSDDNCGTNRIIHASSITPAVPCQLILDHVTTLSLQISQLLVSFFFHFIFRAIVCCLNYKFLKILHNEFKFTAKT